MFFCCCWQARQVNAKNIRNKRKKHAHMQKRNLASKRSMMMSELDKFHSATPIVSARAKPALDNENNKTYK